MPLAEPCEGPSSSGQDPPDAASFQTTHWTTVLDAGNPASSDWEAALARVCQTYWRPVYAYVRHRSYSPEIAQDLTQSFFERLLEKNYLGRADRNRGRFRSFLMTAVEHFLCDEYDRATSLKRGGGQAPLSLDAVLGEEAKEPATPSTPELAFEKQWARTLIEEVMAALRREYAGSDKLAMFEKLQPHLWGEAGAVSYQELARDLQMSGVHVRVIAHRMRHRYRQILRQKIAETVSSPQEVDSEINYLMRVVSLP
jgi:RNA polymerase sigma factor (sigma-70 family)